MRLINESLISNIIISAKKKVLNYYHTNCPIQIRIKTRTQNLCEVTSKFKSLHYHVSYNEQFKGQLWPLGTQILKK